MPQVNKLGGGSNPNKPGSKPTGKPAPVPAKPVKPAPAPAAPPPPPPRPVPAGRERVTLTKADVGTVSVGTVDTKALQRAAGGLKLPAFLQRADNMPTVMADMGTGGYIGFADPQSKKWAMMQAAGLEHGDPFVFTDNQYTQCKPLQYFLLMGDSFRTTMEGQEGKFTFVTRDTDTPLRDLAEAFDNARARNACLKAEPHYCCLCLVNVGESLVPVRADFRGTKSGAASSAILAVRSAEDPEWLRLSEAHKVTAAFPHAWGRVFNFCTTKYKVGKTSGNGFYVANCVSKPATVDQMQLLVDAFNDDEFLAKLDDCETSYQSRVEFLDRIAAGESEEPANETAQQ